MHLYAYFGQCAVGVIESAAEKSTSSAFSLSISFDERTTHDGLHVGVYLWAERRASCCQNPDLASEAFPDLREDEAVIKGMVVSAIFSGILELGRHSAVDEALFDSSFVGKLVFNAFDDPAENPGNRNEHCDLQSLAVLLEFQHIAT